MLTRRELEDREVQSLGVQLLDALAYMHAGPRFIMHRDIKLENVLFCQPDDLETLKVADFGSCASFASDSDPSACPFSGSFIVGTRFYASPEKRLSFYGPKADIWAAG